MKPTLEFMVSLKPHYQIHEIITPEDDRLAYHNGLKQIWGQDDIIVIEQDVLPSLEFIRSLEFCNHKNCGAPVLLCESHTGLPRKMRMILDMEMIPGTDNVQRWIELPWGTEFAMSLGLACVKISKESQLSISNKFLASEWYFPRLDEQLVRALQTQFHVHYKPEVEHNCV